MRADKFFAAQFGSRTKAASALARGLILKNGVPLRAKDDVAEGDQITVLSETLRYVSEGGYKLERGLDAFQIDLSGGTYADLGSSTGGFTDCLLQRGAARVFCVDVGESLLDERLRLDRRVVVMDHTNARYLTLQSFPVPLDGVTCDLSFISLRLVLPTVAGLLQGDGKAFVLFKPQFECGGKGLGKSGILPVKYHGDLLKEFYRFCVSLCLSPQNIVNAPIREKKNVEYVVYLKRDAVPISEQAFLRAAEHRI